MTGEPSPSLATQRTCRHLDVLRQLESDSSGHRAALRHMDHADLEVGVSDDAVEICRVDPPVGSRDRAVVVGVLALGAAGQRGNPEHDTHQPTAVLEGRELVCALTRVDDLDEGHLIDIPAAILDVEVRADLAWSGRLRDGDAGLGGGRLRRRRWPRRPRCEGPTPGRRCLWRTGRSPRDRRRRGSRCRRGCCAAYAGSAGWAAAHGHQVAPGRRARLRLCGTARPGKAVAPPFAASPAAGRGSTAARSRCPPRATPQSAALPE